jgi:hypothetical protein
MINVNRKAKNIGQDAITAFSLKALMSSRFVEDNTGIA